MICKNNKCKAELPDDATFCLKCGAKQDVPTSEIAYISNETNKIKMKPLIIAIIVFIIIACIIIGCILIIPKVIVTKYTSPDAETTTTAVTEEIIYPLYHCPFVINELTTSTPNSAGGVDLIIDWENRTNDEIKYVYIYVTPYNKVGDIEASEIGGKTTANCRLVGPLNTGDNDVSTSKNVWYNNDISYAKVIKIELEFMDGTIRTYE